MAKNTEDPSMLDTLQSFFYANPEKGPTNFPAMEARRRMALQLMASNARKGYPKNIGEGLSAIGDALGERGMMNRLSAQEANYQKSATEAAEEGVPGEARPGATPQRTSALVEPVDEGVPVEPPTQTAEAAPSVLQRPPAQLSGMSQQAALTPAALPPSFFPADMGRASPPPSQLALPPGGGGASVNSPQIASLNDTIGNINDMGGVSPQSRGFRPAPPALAGGGPMNPVQASQLSGLNSGPPAAPASPYAATAALGAPPVSPNPRAAIASILQARDTAQGVPQPNPTSGAGNGLPLVPTGPAGSPPEAEGNRPIPLNGARLAQNVNGVTPATIPPAPLPSPAPAPDVARQRVAPEPRIPLPTDLPMTEDEKRGYRMRAKAAALGDQGLLGQADKLIAYGAEQRKQQYDARMQDFRDQMAARRTEEAAVQAFKRGEPERKIEREKATETLIEARNKNILREQFGNMAPEEAYKRLDASRALAQGARQSLVAAREAQKAFENGAITGIGANQKLDVAKLFTSMGLVDKGDIIRNTETFRGAMQPIVASILHQTSGTSQLSGDELKFAQSAAAGNITLDPHSIKELMRIINTRSAEILRDHRELTTALFPDDNKAAKALWHVAFPPTTPEDEARQWVRDHPNDQRAAKIRQKLGMERH